MTLQVDIRFFILLDNMYKQKDNNLSLKQKKTLQTIM